MLCDHPLYYLSANAGHNDDYHYYYYYYYYYYLDPLKS